MKPILYLILFVVAVGPLSADDQVDEIYSRFVEGDLVKAAQLYRQLPPISVRDGNRLFIAAILEHDALGGRDKLMAALQSNLDGKYKEEVHFRLIQLAEAVGDTAEVLARAGEFLDRWEDSGYRGSVMAILAAHSSVGGDEQERYLRLLSDEYPGSYFGQFARLVRAEAAFKRGHYKTATTQCRHINNSADDNLAPSSLIMLARIALIRNDAEKALLNYNILREQYRHAIGQELLVDELQRTSEKQSSRESTEIFEGVTYSVQVGVFSVKNNAKNLSDRVKAYGYKGKIVKRKISDKTYHVVLAGKFKTMSEAELAKEKLERGENQIFKVVINDEK